jgi:arabinoxylan arabinofuranohydrolase
MSRSAPSPPSGRLSLGMLLLGGAFAACPGRVAAGVPQSPDPAGSAPAARTFSVSAAGGETFTSYLFAFFTGNTGDQESIRFALSDDGYDFKAVNKGKPVLGSAAISSSGGVRDPHILRGRDGDYYMVATDMVSAQGWASNRAMVLLKSTNLVDWKSTVVNIPKTYSAFAAADRVWAPETIYDSIAGKYMVYFAMRLGSSDPDKIYWAYANSEFTGLEAAPKVLYSYDNKAAIDADIVVKDGSYHLFFKDEGNGNGIKTAVSNKLTGTYTLYGKYVQPTTLAAEGPEVFRRIGSDSCILMYDLYTSGGFQFAIGTDLYNFTVAKKTATFDFTPRHGAVIPITAAEKQAINAKWNPTGLSESGRPARLAFTCDPENRVLHLVGASGLGEVSVVIRDPLGRERIRRTLQAGNTRIDLSGLAPGVYRAIGATGNGERWIETIALP